MKGVKGVKGVDPRPSLWRIYKDISFTFFRDWRVKPTPFTPSDPL